LVLPGDAFQSIADGRGLFGIPRMIGIAGHPNTLGMIAAPMIVLEIHSRRLPWLIPALIAFPLSQSTTAWLAVIAGLACTQNPAPRAMRVALVALVPVIAVTAAFAPAIVRFLPRGSPH
jgi:hypothetical protein